MLVSDLEQLNLDLLSTRGTPSEITPNTIALQLAATKFQEQMEKAGLSLSCIREARLTLTKLPGLKNGRDYGHSRVGFDLVFEATAVTDRGRKYTYKTLAFVAPHDPRVEQQSRNVNERA
ncbi:MAG: hypothetical protein ACRD6N_08500 [Pyrinomonadaceae bacterium]